MVRDKGVCPCPWCLIPKTKFHHFGFLSDAVQRVKKLHQYFRDRIVATRNAIYKHGAPIKGAVPEFYLKPLSLVPTFVCCLFLFSSRSNIFLQEHLC